jgi:hypothetical protein
MKSAEFLKELRKIIREEIEIALDSRLETLNEVKQPTQTKRASSTLSSILPPKTQPKRNIPVPEVKNPLLASILNETAMSMTGDDYRTAIDANSSMAPNFAGIMRNSMPPSATPVVESVDSMLASTNITSDINQVQINAVPDFSALMGKLKENGSI